MTLAAPPFTHPDANCNGVNTNLFFPEHGTGPAHQALAICKECPPACKQACLDYAIEHRQPGVWGGTTGRQRRTMTSSVHLAPRYPPTPSCVERCIAELRASKGTWVTTRELSRRTGNSAATINNELGKQHTAGTVERAEGPRRAAYWRIKAQVTV